LEVNGAWTRILPRINLAVFLEKILRRYFCEYFYSRFIAILKSLGFLAMSALPPEAEIVRLLRHVRKVPTPEVPSTKRSAPRIAGVRQRDIENALESRSERDAAGELQTADAHRFGLDELCPKQLSK
jgi:hypothetical protein